MTNEEKDLLIAYLVDASEIDPDGGIEAQFLDWYQIREETVSGEVHYKAILDAARAGSGPSRRDGRRGWPRPSWAGTRWQPSPGCTASWTTPGGGVLTSRPPRENPRGGP